MAQATIGQADAVTTSGAMITASGEPLKVSLARAERKKRLTAFFLVIPLLIFILVTFIVLIGDMAAQQRSQSRVGSCSSSIPRSTWRRPIPASSWPTPRSARPLSSSP